jgi:hypothetical protein
MGWDVGDPESRSLRIQSAANAIRTIALPYFAAFEDIPTLVQLLEQKELPSMRPKERFDFLACFADKNSLQNAVKQYISAEPSFIPEIWKGIEALRKGDEVNPYGTPRASAIATAIVKFELDESYVFPLSS